MKFVMTQEDIDKANEAYDNYRSIMFTCPISQCINRTLRIDNAATTTNRLVEISDAKYFLPDEAIDFVIQWDTVSKIDISPIEFELSI